MKQILLYSLALLLCAASCKKEKTAEDQLPPVTQTGANTFGFLVNGKVFIPKGYSGTGTPNPKIAFDYYNGNNIFSVVAKQFDKDNSPAGYFTLSFFKPDLLPGIYVAPASLNFSIGWLSIIGDCGTVTADTTIFRAGIANVSRFDNINRIVSGTFSCKVKRNNCDTVFITQGRFDFKF